MPPLQDSLHFFGLPGTAVPGFHMPPLRGSAAGRQIGPWHCKLMPAQHYLGVKVRSLLWLRP